MLPQVEPFEEPFHIGRKDFLGGLAGVEHEKYRDESLDDVGVAVRTKHDFGGLGARDGHEPDPTQTSWDQVLLIPEFLRVGLQLSPKLDEVSIAVLGGAQPIEALGEFVGSHESSWTLTQRAMRSERRRAGQPAAERMDPLLNEIASRALRSSSATKGF